MILGETYSYFFENNGVCPECGKLLTMNVGCINIRCKLCKEIMKSDDIIKFKILAYERRRKKSEEFSKKKLKEFKKYKRHLDKCQEKKYAKVKHS